MFSSMGMFQALGYLSPPKMLTDVTVEVRLQPVKYTGDSYINQPLVPAKFITVDRNNKAVPVGRQSSSEESDSDSNNGSHDKLTFMHPSVSRYHGEFYLNDKGDLIYEDLASKNGSTWNDKYIEPNVPFKLTSGGILKLGARSNPLALEVTCELLKENRFVNTAHLLSPVSLNLPTKDEADEQEDKHSYSPDLLASPPKSPEVDHEVAKGRDQNSGEQDQDSGIVFIDDDNEIPPVLTSGSNDASTSASAGGLDTHTSNNAAEAVAAPKDAGADASEVESRPEPAASSTSSAPTVKSALESLELVKDYGSDDDDEGYEDFEVGSGSDSASDSMSDSESDSNDDDSDPSEDEEDAYSGADVDMVGQMSILRQLFPNKPDHEDVESESSSEEEDEEEEEREDNGNDDNADEVDDKDEEEEDDDEEDEEDEEDEFVGFSPVSNKKRKRPEDGFDDEEEDSDSDSDSGSDSEQRDVVVVSDDEQDEDHKVTHEQEPVRRPSKVRKIAKESTKYLIGAIVGSIGTIAALVATAE